MDVEVKSASFKPSDPISVLSFLYIFNTACDSNGIQDGAALWIFQRFMKDPAKAGFAHRGCVTKEDDSKQEGKGNDILSSGQLSTYHICHRRRHCRGQSKNN